MLVIEPDEVFDDTAYLFLGLLHGKSSGAAMIASEDEREAEFVLRAPFGNWRRVIEGELEPIQGMMTRKLRLTGNLMKVMRYPKAAMEIIACCTLIDTEFPS